MSIFTKVPFPGLRAFEQTEKDIFFGRERQLDELLRKLRSNRFLAVVGTPSSGKSSLVRASLVPKLHEGFAGQAGSNWRIAVCRPGNNPMQNLSKQLAQRGVLHSEDMMDPNFPAVVEATLRRGSLGIVEAFKQSGIKRGENLMIVIDQFEEIFRYAGTSIKQHEEAANFINLLLNASRQKEQPIYIVVTMRSNFLGACTDFRGLPESINDGQFLIPRMKSEELKKAIIGPIKFCGADIEMDLVNRIVADLGEDFDELGTLQHLLMRMWDQWLNAEGGDASVKIAAQHYDGVGTIKGALAKHAEEVYTEMDDEAKREACQRMFRALVEKGNDGQATRRPQTVRELMRVVGSKDLKFMRNVVIPFSGPGRLFLSAPDVADFDEDSSVSIAHESLIQRWPRLDEWSKEEFASADEYQRIAAAATLYYEGKGSLLRDPELTLGLKWFDPAVYDPEHAERLAPNQQWADRYNSIFYETIEYLKESERERDRQLAMVRNAQDEQMQKARRMALGGIMVALFCLLLLAFAVAAGDKARRSAKIAAKNEQEAKRQTFLAEMSKQEAARKAFEARLQAALAQEEKEKADQATIIAMKSSELANAQAAKAREASAQAYAAAKDADYKSAIAAQKAREAEDSARVARDQRLIAQRERDNALRIKGLSLAQSVAVNSLKAEEDQVQGLLANEAFALNTINDGKPYDAFIYDAVYEALNRLEGSASNAEFNLLDQVPEGAINNGAIRAIVPLPNGNGSPSTHFFTTGSSGWLLKWQFKTYTTSNEKHQKGNLPEALQRNQNNRVYRTMDITSDGKYLVRAGDETFVQVYDLAKNTPSNIDVHNRQTVWALRVLPKTVNNIYGFISVGNDYKMRYTSINGQSSSVLVDSLPARITSLDLAVSGQGQMIVGSSDRKNDVYFWQMSSNKRIDMSVLKHPTNTSVVATAVAMDPLGEFVAAGYQDGSLVVWQIQEFLKNPKTYIPFKSQYHEQAINDIAFSPDGYRMAVASASKQKGASLWLIRDPYTQFSLADRRAYPFLDTKFRPIELNSPQGGWTMSVAFDNNGERLITGSQNGTMRIWEVDPIAYADRLCGHLRNNLSNAEWRRFIGTDGPDDAAPYIVTPSGNRVPKLTCEGKSQRPEPTY